MDHQAGSNYRAAGTRRERAGTARERKAEAREGGERKEGEGGKTKAT